MPARISSGNAALIKHLKEISSWVSSVQDLDKLLELIIESAAQVVQAKAASLLLVENYAMHCVQDAAGSQESANEAISKLVTTLGKLP